MDAVFGRVVHPMILPFYEEIPLDDVRRVAVVTVTQGATKPYVVQYRGREDIYVRVGSTSRLASREQQARLFAAGGLIHTELLPVSGSGLCDLSRARLVDYLTTIIDDREVPETDEEWNERLCALGFTGRAGRRAACLYDRGVDFVWLSTTSPVASCWHPLDVL